MTVNKIRTHQGVVEGIDQGSYTVFKGIPYASPPVGDLRFSAPQPPQVRSEILKADRFSAKCIQQDSPSDFYKKEFYSNPDFEVANSEDCLYLNIWTPAQNSHDKLPVALYIHGGGFLGGHGGELEFDGAAYCDQQVILVTINYRLGPLGFLAHPWQDADGESGNSGNNGFLDQVAALRWVYENIREFGGDPTKITILGQSAGCMSVQTLVTTPLTENMINGAILQSGGGYKRAFANGIKPEDALAIGSRIIEIAGIASLEELKEISSDQLMEAFSRFMPEHMKKGGMLPFGPIIDGHLIGDTMDNLTGSGQIKKIPYMIGSTQKDILVDSEQLAKGDKGQLYSAAINWSLQNEKRFNRPSYVYYFTRDLPGDDAGAFHSSELWYMFGTLERSWRPNEPCDQELARQMVAYWCNFIKTGDPNGPGLPTWEPCTEETEHVQILDCKS